MVWKNPIAEAQDHSRIEILFVQQLHSLNHSRAANSSAKPFSVSVRPTVTQSQQLKRRKPKHQTKLHLLSLDSFRNWATEALKCLSKTPTYDDLQKTTSSEHMFSANMREHMFRKHVFANTRTQRTYVHDPATYMYMYRQRLGIFSNRSPHTYTHAHTYVYVF